MGVGHLGARGQRGPFGRLLFDGLGGAVRPGALLLARQLDRLQGLAGGRGASPISLGTTAGEIVVGGRVVLVVVVVLVVCGRVGAGAVVSGVLARRHHGSPGRRSVGVVVGGAGLVAGRPAGRLR